MISPQDLNEAQREAALHHHGPLIIFAGAGSGKTRTLTYRMSLMQTHSQISPSNILAITFTNKAAKEMKLRCKKLIKTSSKMTICTFHSLGVKILRKEIARLGYRSDFSIMDTSDSLGIIREILKNYVSEKKDFDIKVLQAQLSSLKNQGIGPNDFTPEDDPYAIALEHVYKNYQERLFYYNSIDFDDILLLTNKLFEEEDIQEKYSKIYTHVLVDEYQDTNDLQFRLLKNMVKLQQNICVVGDDDQSIYAFRGANVNNLLGFHHHFPKAKVIKLEQNYRSNQPILELANRIIACNKNRVEKKLWSTIQSENLPQLLTFGDPDHEALNVVEDLAKKQQKGELNSVALLFRSHTQVSPFEDYLRSNSLPYTVVGGQKTTDKKEIKDIVSYLAFICNPSYEIGLRRILNTPNRGIGLKTLKDAIEISDRYKISLYRSLQGLNNSSVDKFCQLIDELKDMSQKLPLADFVEQLIKKIGFWEYLEKCYPKTHQLVKRRQVVQNFIYSARRFQDYHKEKANLKKFVEKLLLVDMEEETPDEPITLLTLHASKGLEFDTVYLVGMEEEILPHKKTIQQGEDISEERRLCYVGITRARKNLIMTKVLQRVHYGKKVICNISRFLNDVSDELYVAQDRTQFGHLDETEVKEYKKNFFDDLISGL